MHQRKSAPAKPFKPVKTVQQSVTPALKRTQLVQQQSQPFQQRQGISKKTVLPRPGVTKKPAVKSGGAIRTPLLKRRTMKQVPPWTRVYNVLKMNKDATTAHMRNLITHKTAPQHAAPHAAAAAENREVPRDVISRAPPISTGWMDIFQHSDAPPTHYTQNVVKFFADLRRSKPDIWGKLFEANHWGKSGSGDVQLLGPRHPTKADIDSLSSFLHEMGMGGFGFSGKKNGKNRKTGKSEESGDNGRKLRNGTTFHIPIRIHKTGEHIEKLGHVKPQPPLKNGTSSLTSSSHSRVHLDGLKGNSLQTDDIRNMKEAKGGQNRTTGPLDLAKLRGRHKQPSNPASLSSDVRR